MAYLTKLYLLPTDSFDYTSPCKRQEKPNGHPQDLQEMGRLPADRS